MGGHYRKTARYRFYILLQHHRETEGIMGEKGRKNIKKPKQSKVKKQEEVKAKE